MSRSGRVSASSAGLIGDPAGYDLDGLADAMEVLDKVSDRTFPWQEVGFSDFMVVNKDKGGFSLTVRASLATPHLRGLGIFRTIEEAFDAAVKAWEPVWLHHIEKNLRNESNVERICRDVLAEFRGLVANETTKEAMKQKLVNELNKGTKGTTEKYRLDEVEVTENPETGDYGVTVEVSSRSRHG